MSRTSEIAIFSVLVLMILINFGCATNPGDRSKNYMAMGYEYYKKGQYDKAIVWYNRALEFNPQNLEAYVNRGNSYATKGQYNLAIADYNKAIEINPNYSIAHHARQYVSVPLNIENYAIFLKGMGRDKEATEMEERADIFLKSLQSKESSYYLGFLPSEVLREYALLLHQEGEANKAVEMNSLADWWDQANINAAEQLYEKTKNKQITEP
jgi:tetratricopeptide (TPR) repeat protein